MKLCTLQDYKHHSTTRISRYYPWKAHEEGKRNQMSSSGGEGRYFLTLFLKAAIFCL